MRDPKPTERFLAERPVSPVMPAPRGTPPADWLDQETASTRRTWVSLEGPPSARPLDRPLLKVLTGFAAGQIFALVRDECVIGRGREADVRLEDAGVSRAHARIVRAADGRYLVEDLSSTNGTFMRGQSIDRAELHPGDRVQIGPKVLLGFSVIDEAEERLARQLYESSTRDALTGAFNRKYLSERLASEFAYARRHRTPLGVLLLDLDRFKLINDGYGHLVGDEVLRCVAAQVMKTIRAEDVFARYGGEEFVVLVRGIEHGNIAQLGERLRLAVQQLEIPCAGTTLRVTISAGVASLEECGELAGGETLLLRADERLYRAKSGGRNRVVA